MLVHLGIDIQKMDKKTMDELIVWENVEPDWRVRRGQLLFQCAIPDLPSSLAHFSLQKPSTCSVVSGMNLCQTMGRLNHEHSLPEALAE